MINLFHPAGKPVFSQTSLQDYLTCPRLYQLRDVWALAWPAVQSEPARLVERHIQQGSDFHQLVRQYFVGIPVVDLTPLAAGDELTGWWEHFLSLTKELPELDPTLTNFRRYSETACTVSYPEYKITAKFDLVVVDETGRAVIFDWKTVRKRPSRERLFAAMQTRVYPLVLALSGRRFRQSQEIAPGEIEMQYIFLEEGGALERFPYSTELMKQDQLAIEGLIQEILAVPEDGFYKTTDENLCRACLYRSYCERGTSPADFLETDDSQFSNQLELDFENLPEEEL